MSCEKRKVNGFRLIPLMLWQIILVHLGPLVRMADGYVYYVVGDGGSVVLK